MLNSHILARVARVVIPTLLLIAVGVFVWTFAFDGVGIGIRGRDERVTSRPADEADPAQMSGGIDEADPAQRSGGIFVYHYPLTVKQAFDTSGVVAMVRVESFGAARWSSGLVPHIFVPVRTQVVEMLKGEQLRVEESAVLKQFGGTVGNFDFSVGPEFYKAGRVGEQSIVFMYPWTVPGSGEIVWVINQSWKIQGGTAVNEVDGVTLSVSELREQIATASQTPVEPLIIQLTPEPLSSPASIQ